MNHSAGSTTDIENKILTAKDEYLNKLNEILSYIKGSRIEQTELQVKQNELHSKAVKYFNLFERSISEGTARFEKDDSYRDNKVNDAINVANTIVKYWKMLKGFKKKYNTTVPRPSERAYSTIQRFIKIHEPEESKN